MLSLISLCLALALVILEEFMKKLQNAIFNDGGITYHQAASSPGAFLHTLTLLNLVGYARRAREQKIVPLRSRLSPHALPTQQRLGLGTRLYHHDRLKHGVGMKIHYQKKIILKILT